MTQEDRRMSNDVDGDQVRGGAGRSGAIGPGPTLDRGQET